jgi:prepilin-type N-terminal cleavage/methylation domain-containing protein
MNLKKRGFSLVEILVVISIIGILTQVVMTTVTHARERALEAKARLQISRIEHAIKEMALDTNKWPSHQKVECAANGSPYADANEIPITTNLSLNTPDSGITQNDTSPVYANWDGPYMDSVPTDPWGNHYFFDTDYYVKNIDDTPCNQSSGYTGCSLVVVIGSLGKNETVGGSPININDYDEDDIIKIISRTSCTYP